MPPPPAPPPAADAVRRGLRAVVAAFCLFLLIRTVGLEPFGVPTGSMAGTFLGNHREAPCPRCGAPVRVGLPARRGRDFARCVCPNCGGPADLSRAPEVPGDRLLVDKTAFQLRPPRRWEVAVFRCPVDDSKPYVKRVVGLPGEDMHLRDGDVYADGRLVRKTLAEARRTRVLVFDTASPPAPDGEAGRWSAEPVAGVAQPPAADGWRDGVLTLDGRGVGAAGVTYHHRPGEAAADEPVRDWLAYNGPPPAPSRTRPADVASPPVHDFFLECDLQVVAGAGAFACRLGDGADYVTADLAVGPGDGPGVRLAGPAGAETTAAGGRLVPGRTYRLEFAFVDRRASLALDGAEVVPPLDLPAAADRAGVGQPAQLGARGATVRVRGLKLSRDLHYRADGRHAGATPFRLGPDEYFVLGDNSADSHDSREWAVPGVPGRFFLGKPFLIHQPLRVARVTVNGQAHEFQTVDWDRLRWLR